MNAILHPKTRGRGFSLVEMSVSLVVVGILGFMLWKFLPQFRSIDETRPVEAQIALADEAIVGFIMANHRLPCPDTDGDGKEDLSAPSAPCPAARGGLPVHTLGLSLPSRLNYGAYQDGSSERSLTMAAERHTPVLPPPEPTQWPLLGGNYVPVGLDGDLLKDIPPEYMPTIGEPSQVKNLSSLTEVEIARDDSGLDPDLTRLNGLDFCAALRDAQFAQSASSLSPFLTANGVTVAYAIAHPGARDADGAGSFFDGLNDGATAEFEPPDRASSDVYDDQVLAVGFGELAARLSCTSILSRANAAGHMARATFNHYEFALAYLQARAFLLDMAYLDLQFAYSGLVFSVLNMVSAAANVILVTAAGIMTVDEASGAVLVIVGTALGVAATIEAVAEVGFAIAGLVDAVDAAKEAAAVRVEAEVHARKMLAAANETARYAVELDTKGLLP
ncbi:MAG: type II secretion system GspH family protein [Candidatus Accumulibacter sp.]|jgi:prepilin-type N-terminal cleavage/methylation domain-containing protein|nr:type II secretion system GspH family protein [Accumulibacter sp.]